MTSIWELNMKDLVGPAIVKLQSTAKDVFSKIDYLEKGFRETTEETTHSLHEQESMLGSLREAAMEFFAVEKFAEMGKEILTGGMAVEMMRVQLNTLTGSTEAGGEAFEKLNDIYKQFPILGKENTMKVGQQLLTVGVHVEDLQDKIYKMGAIAGGNADKLNNLAEAYTRAVAYGSVQSRQLIGQPVLMQELGRMYNMTGVELRKFAAEGNISLDALNKAFNNLTGDGGKFHNMLENLNDTMTGRVAHMKMEWEEMGEKMFNALEPAMFKLTDLAEKYLPKVEDALRNVWHTAKNVFGFFEEHQMIFYIIAGGVTAYYVAAALATGWTAALGAVKWVLTAYEIVTFAIAESTSLWTAAQWLLNVALDANPIGVVIVAIGALVGGVLYAWNHFAGFRKFLYSLWETFKQVFTNIGNFFKEIFSPISKFLDDFENKRYKAAAGDLAQLAFNLSPVGMAVKATQFAQKGGFTNGVSDAWKRGQELGKDPRKNNATNVLDNDGSDTVSKGIKNSLAGNESGGGASSASGSTGKNITINITQLGPKEITMHVAKAGDDLKEFANNLKKVLIAVVNDAEVAM